MTLLEAREASMAFGGVRAVDGVSLALDVGHWRGLIGPNGSGKSTLLNVFSGVYRPTGGQVLLRGVRIDGTSARLRARRGVVRTFQHPHLAASLTLRENIGLGADLARRRGRGDTAPSIDEVLDLFGCDGFADVLPEHAPYGVRKIAEVARAVAADPEVLLLDEPAAGLSAAERVELVAALTRFRKSRPEVVVCLVEHDVSIVRALVDAIAVLQSGRLLADGPAEVVLTDDRVKAAYLGRSDSTRAHERSTP